MDAESDQLPTTLLTLLSNSIVLRHVTPYIPVTSLLALAATNKSFSAVINDQPEPWRYLDLTTVRSARIEFYAAPIDVGGVSWRAERMDESLTEDDFYAGPLRGIFSRFYAKQVLRNVQTLILDGLSVPADLVRDILCEDRYSVRILSLRGCGHLNQTKLQQVLNYCVRPTRAEGTPKLRALYLFQPKDAPRESLYHQRLESGVPLGVTSSEGAQIGAEWNRKSETALSNSLSDDEMKWYGCTGRFMKRPLSGWSFTIAACKGLIAFDAVLCRGPRHDITKTASKDFLHDTVATVALGSGGCESCHSCPEGPAVFGESAASCLPLLSPPPTHASTVRAAQYPQTTATEVPKLILRCEDCLRGRWCERCNRWWCEDCYEEPVSRMQKEVVLQQMSEGARDASHPNGQESGMVGSAAVKVYSKLCVEHCLVSEMMSGAGSNGMWG